MTTCAVRRIRQHVATSASQQSFLHWGTRMLVGYPRLDTGLDHLGERQMRSG